MAFDSFMSDYFERSHAVYMCLLQILILHLVTHFSFIIGSVVKPE